MSQVQVTELDTIHTMDAPEPEALAVVPYVDAAQEQAERDWLAEQLSEETRRAYRSDLRQFQAWYLSMGLVGGLADVRRRHIVAYRDALHEQGYAPASIARKLSTIRQAFQHACDEGLLEANPAKTVKTFKVPQISPRRALDNPQVRKLLAQPDRATLQGKRDYALLMVMVYEGLRRSEVASLTCGLFGRERSHTTLTITGKGGKTRLLAVPPTVEQAVREWLEADGRSLDEGGASPVFRALADNNHRRGVCGAASQMRPLHHHQVWALVKKYVRQAGLNIDPHTLRHTSLSAALDGGAAIRDVQAMAGHADPKTTMRYDTRRRDLDQSAVYRVQYD